MRIQNNAVLLVCLLVFGLLNRCERPEASKPEGQAGELISGVHIHSYSETDMGQIIQSMGITESVASLLPVVAVKLVYYSTDLSGKLIKLSGALLLPGSGSTHPLLSLQHGTVSGRQDVASVNPFNSTAGLVGLLTATRGYVTAVPDFPGFGESDILHPYLHADYLSRSILDMLRASKTYCNDNGIHLDERLFLTGYSEGGYATLAVQRALEASAEAEFNLTAVAPMAGPYDLNGTVQLLLPKGSYAWPAYLGFLFTAYNELYSLGQLEDVFQPPYAEMMPSLYAGNLNFSQINGQLPTVFSELLQEDFLEQMLSGTETEYSAAFSDNNLLDWSPNAPIRFYHGTADETVPYEIALRTADSLRARGGNDIQVVGITDANHETAGVPAILSMLEWFSTFSSTSS